MKTVPSMMSRQLRLLVPSAILARTTARFHSRRRTSLALPTSMAWRSFMRRSWKGSGGGRRWKGSDGGWEKGKRKETARVSRREGVVVLRSWGENSGRPIEVQTTWTGLMCCRTRRRRISQRWKSYRASGEMGLIEALRPFKKTPGIYLFFFLSFFFQELKLRKKKRDR